MQAGLCHNDMELQQGLELTNSFMGSGTFEPCSSLALAKLLWLVCSCAITSGLWHPALWSSLRPLQVSMEVTARGCQEDVQNRLVMASKRDLDSSRDCPIGVAAVLM